MSCAIVGALLTGVFVNPALGGSGVYDYGADAVAAYSLGAQMTSQIWGVLVACVWSAIVSLVALYLIKATIGLRVSEQEEREGLDITSHGERAYN